MNHVPGRRCVGSMLLSVLALAGCGSVRPSEHAPAESPPQTPSLPLAAMPPLEPSVPSSEVDANAVSSVAAASAARPACTCADAKSKPLKKSKPKPVHRKAPPQLPTAPLVASTAPGGVVDAQVRSMSVAVMSILGKRVRGPAGEDLGRVVDVLADATGRVRVAIIDFGGFLGVGNHRIAVDWPLLRFNPDGRDPSLLLSLSRAKLQAAPEYKDNPRPQTLMEPAPAARPAEGAK